LLLNYLCSHAIDEPVENRDYYKDYEAPQGRKPDFKPSDSTVILQMERPSCVSPPGEGYYGCFDDDDDEDDDDDDDDFYSLFPFF